jgi:hypothetical protein
VIFATFVLSYGIVSHKNTQQGMIKGRKKSRNMMHNHGRKENNDTYPFQLNRL